MQVCFNVCAEAGHLIRQDKRGQQLLSLPLEMGAHLFTLVAVTGLALGATTQACHTAPSSLYLYFLARALGAT